MPEIRSSRRDLAKGLAFLGLVASAPAAMAQGAAASGSGAIDAAVRAAHAKYRGLNEGKNADYIPALAKVPSTYFGIALTTPQGHTALQLAQAMGWARVVAALRPCPRVSSSSTGRQAADRHPRLRGVRFGLPPRDA